MKALSPSRWMTLLGVLILMGFAGVVGYGLYTGCDDVAIYVYCEASGH